MTIEYTLEDPIIGHCQRCGQPAPVRDLVAVAHTENGRLASVQLWHDVSRGCRGEDPRQAVQPPVTLTEDPGGRVELTAEATEDSHAGMMVRRWLWGAR